MSQIIRSHPSQLRIENQSTPLQPLHKIHLPRNGIKRTGQTDGGKASRPVEKAKKNQDWADSQHDLGRLDGVNEHRNRKRKRKKRPQTRHAVIIQAREHAHFKPKSPFCFWARERKFDAIRNAMQRVASICTFE